MFSDLPGPARAASTGRIGTRRLAAGFSPSRIVSLFVRIRRTCGLLALAS